MAYFQNHICRIIVFITALQILNISIDGTSGEMNAGKASCEQFNYIDSYVEYVAEVILNLNNAIPESNHGGHKDMQQHKHMHIAIQKLQPATQIFYAKNKTGFYSTSSDSYAYQFVKEINPPPPKAC